MAAVESALSGRQEVIKETSPVARFSGGVSSESFRYDLHKT